MKARIRASMDDMDDPESNINNQSLSSDDCARLKAERERETADRQSYYKTAPDTFVSEEIPIEFNEAGFNCGINMGYKEMTELTVEQFSERGAAFLSNISFA